MIQRELPVDLLEFFYLTPLPGSEDHRKLYQAGTEMDPDMNKYDLNHVTTAHPRMSRQEWEQTYAHAWSTYYSIEHIETVLRRAMATGVSPGKALILITWFKGCIDFERIHPLEGGFLRLKFRRSRRSGMARESVWTFYPKYFFETFWKQTQWTTLFLRLHLLYRKIKTDPRRHEYVDLALTPVVEDEDENRELFGSEVAKAYLEQQRRLEKMRRGEQTPSGRTSEVSTPRYLDQEASNLADNVPPGTV